MPTVYISAQFKNPLDSLLYCDTSAVIRKVMSNPDKYRLQIIYSQLDYSNKKTAIKEYTFRLKPEEYFYPASLVKLPEAALALEKLNNLKIKGVDKTTSLVTNPKYAGFINDSIGYPSLADDILQMMVVSDNYAFNRVYDFLGQEYTHLRLFQKGYTNTRLIQRLSSSSTEEDRTTGPFKFVDTCGNVLYEEDELTTTKLFLNPAQNTNVGKAYFNGRKKVHAPKDFSPNNFLPLKDAHQMLISIMSPEFIQPSSRFELNGSDYKFLRKTMGMYPRESGIVAWRNDSIYYDCFRKCLYYGNYTGPADPSIRIFNKVGMAYGFISDVAYFVDTKNKVDFFLSAVIYVNENETLNDGKYEYYSVGFPFMEKLGKMVYRYELSRDPCVRKE
ncbi:MAG TPA: serine hydrolase [Cytophagaceae bacterium]|nr:serine hydrolase [Cytophagaceae bacterium]